MSQENVKAWGRVLEAFNERNLEGMMAELDPDVVSKPLVAGGTDEGYRGEQGIRDWLAAVDEGFEFFVVRLDRFEDHGDYALAVGHLHARGRTSGGEVRRPSVHVGQFENGKVVWWQTFTTREEALKAVGLRE